MTRGQTFSPITTLHSLSLSLLPTEGSHASGKVLYFLGKISRTWKVLEHEFDDRIFRKLQFRVLGSMYRTLCVNKRTNYSCYVANWTVSLQQFRVLASPFYLWFTVTDMPCRTSCINKRTNYSCYVANWTVSLQLVINVLWWIVLPHCMYIE